MNKKILSLILLVFSVNSLLFSSGFQINENGARALSMANAFTGLADDPSAVHFNPAGITQLSGTRFLFGTTLIMPAASFRGPSPSVEETKMKEKVFTPINFYFTQQLSDKLFFGFGVNNPYGLGTSWDEEWVGRYMTTDVEIRTFNFTPVIAYKLMENLSISAGFTYSYADVIIEKMVGFAPFSAPDAKVNLEGDGSGFGFTAGLLFNITKDFSFGASYRSSIDYEFEGTAVTENAPAQFASRLPNGGIKAPLTVPDNLNFGIAFKGIDNLLLTADIQFVGWSSYDSLIVNREDGSRLSASAREYENSYIVRFGTEYGISNKLDLRGGLFYDKNPVPDERLDPTLPDADRLGFNIGLGYKFTEKFGIDIAYLFLRFAERTITNSEESYASSGFAPMNGTYTSSANLFGINLSYNF